MLKRGICDKGWYCKGGVIRGCCKGGVVRGCCKGCCKGVL